MQAKLVDSQIFRFLLGLNLLGIPRFCADHPSADATGVPKSPKLCAEEHLDETCYLLKRYSAGLCAGSSRPHADRARIRGDFAYMPFAERHILALMLAGDAWQQPLRLDVSEHIPASLYAASSSGVRALPIAKRRRSTCSRHDNCRCSAI